MIRLLKLFWASYCAMVDKYASKSLAGYKDRNWFSCVTNFVVMLGLEAIPILLGILALREVYRARKLLLSLAMPPLLVALLIASYFENHKRSDVSTIDSAHQSSEIETEFKYQRGLEMQVYAMSLMLRVLIAISAFTAVSRPRNERDIESCTADGASFYMKDNVLIYQAEIEVEGEITSEVEESLRREIQRYALKYIIDYPMLISPEAGGHAPVEVLGVKNCGNRVLIDFVFTTKDSIPTIEARRRARIERQKRRDRITQYIDEDYGE